PLCLALPVSLPRVCLGRFGGVAAPLAGAFVVGTGVPYLVYSLAAPVQAPVLASLLVAGAVVSVVFTGLAFWLGVANEERAKALGLALGVWLLLSIVYDGLVLFFIVIAQAYPIETAVMGLTLLNPIDLSRVLVLLRLDTAALLGYTGALFARFLGSPGGTALACGALLTWAVVPAWLGLRAFRAKDF